MKIEIIQLENIRSHVKSTVPFARGFNCLVGGLGCGKSSILYATDFVLFGEPIGRSYEYLLREGAENGRVTVQFSQNGKSYRISRGLKRRGKSINQDADMLEFFENEVLVSSVKSDAVSEQLKAVTGLDKELFREIVWIKQEHLKELLDITPRERQTRLDRLFGLSEYETAWNDLAGYQREFEGERRAYEKDPDIAGVERLSTEYSRAAEEFSLVEVELDALAKKLNTARKALEDADAKLGKMEEIRTKTEEYMRKETQLQVDLKNVNNASNRLNKNIEEKTNNIEKLKKILITQEKQVESCFTTLKDVGIEPNQPIDAMSQRLTFLDDQVVNLKGEKEAALRTLRENEERASLSDGNRCPVCLQQLTEEYKSGLTRRLKEENDKHREAIKQFTHRIEELQQAKAKANNAFSALQQLLSRAEDSRTRINEETQVLEQLNGELELNRKLGEEIRLRLESVEIEIARFDLSELETAKIRSKQALENFHMLESELKIKEDRKRSLLARLDETKERIDQAQRKIEQMEKTAKLLEMIGSIRDSYRNIQPKLRREFVKILRNFVQQVLDELVGGKEPLLNVTVDETYTPCVKTDRDIEREVTNLSGGERTLLAFAYRLGLGQLIMQSRTGHGLGMLLLDEPTESLGSEDGSIERLAEAVSRFKAVEQIIAVTHSDAFAEKAEHVVRLEKEAGVSKASVER